MSKSVRLGAAVRAALGVASIVWALAVPGAAHGRETISIGYQRSSALLILLKQNGTLETKLNGLGYDVSWHEFSAGLLDAMDTASVDLNADVADAFALFTQAANAALTYYAEETSSPGAQGIVVAEDSPIRTVADLKGKSIAVDKGSGAHYLLIAALRKAGLTPSDVQIRYLGAPDGLAAFRGHSVEAWSVWDPFLATEQRDDHARLIADGSGGVAQYNRFYTARTAFADAHPDVLRVVFAALADEGKWVKAHPHDAALALRPVWGNLPVETIELVLGRRSFGIVPVRRDQLGEQQRIADAYRAAGLIPGTLSASSIRIWTP